MTAGSANITCEEVEELAGAYALDALPEEEFFAVEEHLADCDNAHSALRDLAETASLLALLVEPAHAPAGLGERIIAAAGVDMPPRTASMEADRDLGRAPVDLLARRLRRSAGPLALAAAAAFALVALGLGIWATSEHGVLARERATARGDAAVLAAIASGSTLVQTPARASMPPALIVQPSDGGPAYLLLNWPQAGSGKTYQAWFISAGQRPASVGVFDGSAGSGFQIVRLARSIDGAQAFAVTLEPAGGSEQPTSQPFVVRNLPG